jgi:hypothetical protein
MTVFDVLYQAGLQSPDVDSDRDKGLSAPFAGVSANFEFEVALSARARCHVITIMSGQRIDRKHRWLIEIHNRQGEVSDEGNFRA